MNNAGPYHLRWRGQTSGPFSREEISQKLDDHEIGLWHEIGHEGVWMPLGEFLKEETRQRTPPPPPPPPVPVAAKSPAPAARPKPIRVHPPAAVAEPAATAAPTSPPPPSPAEPPAPVPRRTRTALFVLLGALLGFTGAHNFYAGYRGTAVAQLLLTGITLVFGFGLFISWVWALIELLIVHTDARGLRMT